MYEIIKTMEISAAHRLTLDHASKCTQLHGHNWCITVWLRSCSLNANGMIMDFTEIKQRVQEPLDHQILNNVLPDNPTAENLAAWVCKQLQPYCYRVEVSETEHNKAIYVRDAS